MNFSCRNVQGFLSLLIEDPLIHISSELPKLKYPCYSDSVRIYSIIVVLVITDIWLWSWDRTLCKCINIFKQIIFTSIEIEQRVYKICFDNRFLGINRI